MSQYDTIVGRLDGVRTYRAAVGIQRAARAFCPAHQPPPHRHGRGRTLSIAETASGQVLLHCHAGCCSADVLAAVCLRLSDLYPEGPVRQSMAAPAWRAWQSLASAADAVGEAAILLAIDPSPAAISRMLTAAHEVSACARTAMRQSREKKK